MASHPTLSSRVRDVLQRTRGMAEKRMFGGDAFLLNGNMLVAVWNNSLIVRLGVDQASAALQQPHVGPMDLTGKPMKGWAIVGPSGLRDDADLRTWIKLAIHFVKTLEPK
jgi:TfoX/Sxy family transcriptional regulator of competence genes